MRNLYLVRNSFKITVRETAADSGTRAQKR